MSKLYVFAIGGTGSRVLKSLTMLLASGVRCDSTIVPVIIDPDASNADMTRTVDLLNLYNQIRKPSNGDTFFKTEIKDETANNWRLPIDNTHNVRFKDFIGIGNMDRDDPNRFMCEALFSNKNFESDMSVGFKGNPNVGSVVLNQFVDSDAFKNLCGNFSQGDRIFIVSSIFGGTGASGFPLLLKTLRSIKTGQNFALINKARIGAITVLPYFSLGTNNNSEIDSSTFIQKTKSALTYYADNISNNNQLDALYYIGDTVRESIQNCEGGAGQKNPAHLIDLVSALAILDFEKMQFANNAPCTTIHKEFGMNDIDEKTKVTFNTFYPMTNMVIRKRLIQMYLTVRYFENHFLTEGIQQAWAKDRKIDNQFVQSPYFIAFDTFMRNFNEWISEMESTKRCFSPFETEKSKDTDVFETIRGSERAKYGLITQAKSYLLIDNFLNGEKDDTSDAANQLLRIFNNATSKATEKMLNQ
ncbi:MAG: hypothetical protein IKP73_03350 [Bacteroidales bacterium]|nr:hypothetical protein [Bacteroidales bacterium]